MRRHLRHWGAVWILAILFLGSWIGQFVTQLIEFRSDQQIHGQAFSWAAYFPTFFASTFENWQSEWFQLIFQAILLMGAKHWIFKTESDDSERLEGKIDDLLDHFDVDHQPRPAKWPDKPKS